MSSLKREVLLKNPVCSDCGIVWNEMGSDQILYSTLNDRFAPVSTFPLGNERREQKERERKKSNVLLLQSPKF